MRNWKHVNISSDLTRSCDEKGQRKIQRKEITTVWGPVMYIRAEHSNVS